MTKNKNSILLPVILKLLKPLARLMMSHGMTYRDFSDIGKAAFIEEAKALLHKNKTKQTVSHLSLISGLHRKDVSTLISTASTPIQTENTTLSTSYAAVIAEWISNPRYLEENNQPKPLPYSTIKDSAPTFCGLIESLSKDVRPNVFLAEMQRLKMISVSDDKNQIITLRLDAFVPNENLQQMADLMGHNIGDHLNAAISNIEGTQPPYFERSAFHDKLSISDVEIIRAIINKEGMNFLKTVYKNAKDLSEGNARTNNLNENNQRITCGVYFYSAPENKQTDGNENE